MSRVMRSWRSGLVGACLLVASAASISCWGTTAQPNSAVTQPSVSTQTQPTGNWSLFAVHSANSQLDLWDGIESATIGVAPSATVSGDASSIDGINEFFRQGYPVRIGTSPAFQYGASVTASALSVQRGTKVTPRAFSGIVIGPPRVVFGQPSFAVDHALVIYLPEWTTIRSDSQFSTIDAIIAGTQDGVNNHICVAGQGYDVTPKGLHTISVGVWVFPRTKVSDLTVWDLCRAK